MPGARASEHTFSPRPRAVIDINPSKMMKIANRAGLSMTDTRKAVAQINRMALLKTINETITYINRYVPMKTGTLRMDLIQTMAQSQSNPNVCALVMGSVLFYIKYVANMPESMVRHAIDPLAVGTFWGKLISYARGRLKLHISQAAKIIALEHKVLARPFLDQMKVVYIK